MPVMFGLLTSSEIGRCRWRNLLLLSGSLAIVGLLEPNELPLFFRVVQQRSPFTINTPKVTPDSRTVLLSR
jgi:hypothetical protein